MFKAGVPEKLIQQRTGHCSLDSLHVYEWASADQQGLQKYSIQLEASVLEVPLHGSTSSLPTLKPVPLESPPGLPPSLSHAWGVHSTCIPVDACALVMYSSYLSTLHFLVMYSDCIFGFLYFQIGALQSCNVMVWHAAE